MKTTSSSLFLACTVALMTVACGKTSLTDDASVASVPRATVATQVLKGTCVAIYDAEPAGEYPATPAVKVVVTLEGEKKEGAAVVGTMSSFIGDSEKPALVKNYKSKILLGEGKSVAFVIADSEGAEIGLPIYLYLNGEGQKVRHVQGKQDMTCDLNW